MRKELICYVTRFLIHSPFMLAVDVLLSPVMIPLNHLDKKPAGLLTISLPALHTSYQESRALPCSYVDESWLRPWSSHIPKKTPSIDLSCPLQGNVLGFPRFRYRHFLSTGKGRVGPHRQELIGWFAQDWGVSQDVGLSVLKPGQS